MDAVNQNVPLIRPALKSDVKEVSQLRLEALQNQPEAFSSDYASERRRSVSDWEAWLGRADGTVGIIFLAYVGAPAVDGAPSMEGGQLAGMAGIFRGHSSKTEHTGTISGVYVRPALRQQGIGRRLMQACTDWAQARGVEQLKLAVVNTNIAAIRLYARCGFQVYGVDPKAIRYNNMAYDDLLMVKELAKG